MSSSAAAYRKLSVVVPVRDAADAIGETLQRLLEHLTDLTEGPTELIVVDDGSRDATPEVLDELKQTFPQIRVLRHGTPRGLEAAGQTGLERATGDLVFIQETAGLMRIEDVRRLLRMAADPDVVAARAESHTPDPIDPLVRRLRAWADQSDRQIKADAAPSPAVQMVRRPHLADLARRPHHQYRLSAERFETVSGS